MKGEDGGAAGDVGSALHHKGYAVSLRLYVVVTGSPHQELMQRELDQIIDKYYPNFRSESGTSLAGVDSPVDHSLLLQVYPDVLETVQARKHNKTNSIETSIRSNSLSKLSESSQARTRP